MDAHLRDLRYFVAVAEELNFTRAAERLHLSQPALSKQIRGLETTLRAPLFRRDRRQVELTPAGTALHAVARSLLQDWDDGIAVVSDAAAQDARVLRVGTLTSIGRAGGAAYLRMGRPDSGPAGSRGRRRIRVAAH
jgi:DNA-binding transcriptional LysR family regulator